jgi:hypothetical protein
VSGLIRSKVGAGESFTLELKFDASQYKQSSVIVQLQGNATTSAS